MQRIREKCEEVAGEGRHQLQGEDVRRSGNHQPAV